MTLNLATLIPPLWVGWGHLLFQLVLRPLAYFPNLIFHFLLYRSLSDFGLLLRNQWTGSPFAHLGDNCRRTVVKYFTFCRFAAYGAWRSAARPGLWPHLRAGQRTSALLMALMVSFLLTGSPPEAAKSILACWLSRAISFLCGPSWIVTLRYSMIWRARAWIFETTCTTLLAPGRRSDFAFGHRQVALDFGGLEIPCLHT